MDDLPLTDRLAVERTRLANERTLLAYVRTALMIAATGVTLLKLFEPTPIVVATGWCLVVAGIAVGVAGGVRCAVVARGLRSGRS